MKGEAVCDYAFSYSQGFLMQVVAVSGGQLIGFSEELLVRSLKHKNAASNVACYVLSMQVTSQMVTLCMNAYFICFDMFKKSG